MTAPLINSQSRRDFTRISAGFGDEAALGGASLMEQNPVGGDSPSVSAKPMAGVRVGFVGVGVKGSEHLANLLSLPGVELRAVCDIHEAACAKALQMAEQAGQRKPAVYSRSDHDFERMCATEELDLVYTATPWEWHTPVCLAAMRSDKHVATEIPAAITVEQCWDLVETSEKTGRYCCMMENVNYMREEMAILSMVRKGVFGELLHAEGAYEHDTRYLKISEVDDGIWLGEHFATRNGNLYPQHGLGPIAWWLNINHGDRLDYLVSMSSNARGMALYATEHLPADHPRRIRKYICGDVNSTLLRTVNGLTIILKHDTDLPRPYSRAHLVQGVRGIVRRHPDFVVSLERNVQDQSWEPGAKFLAEHEHPLWKQALEREWRKSGHATEPVPSGEAATPLSTAITGDFLEDLRLIQALQTGAPPDFDVYDAATWSVVGALSEQSVADRSRPMDIPDFTKGKWKTNPPVKIMGV